MQTQGRILVIGAGLSGLVFALTAAMCGRKVSVLEQNPGLDARATALCASPVWTALGLEPMEAGQMRATLAMRLRALPGAEIVFNTRVLRVRKQHGGVMLELEGAQRMYGQDVFTGASDVYAAWVLARALQTG